MSEASSLPAIRERTQAWQEEQAAAAARGWKWTGPPEVPGLREEVAFLLALVARLQGEREAYAKRARVAEAALDNTVLTLGDRARGLRRECMAGGPDELLAVAHELDNQASELHGRNCDARATLPTDACVACTYDRGTKTQLCAACAARAALGEE